MATTPHVSVEEYLRTSYRPDVEYIDGELRPKNSVLEEDPVVQWVHGRLQTFIGSWFEQHEDEWDVLAAVEVRTRISPSIYRLPDVVIVRAEPEGGEITEPPLIVIEILSPRDTYSDTQRRAREYQIMGVENIWIIDPDTRTARVCTGENWREVSRFVVEDSPIFLDLEATFAKLDRRTMRSAKE